MATKLNENTELAIPLKSLLGLIAGTAVAVWAYFGVIERIAFLELKEQQDRTKLDFAYKWVQDFTPPPAVADAVVRVRNMELQIKELEIEVKHLKEQLNNGK
jgi:hypothetical protein